MLKCLDCGGHGDLEIADNYGGYPEYRIITCETCDGSGRVWRWPQFLWMYYDFEMWLRRGFHRCPDPDCREWQSLFWVKVGEHNDCVPF